MNIELRHLRILQAIFEHGSLTRAATGLGVSQPTLTKQIQRIEEELGGAVFQRGRLGASPTPFGEFILARTRAALANIDEILAYKPGHGSLGRLRFGGTMPAWLGGLLDQLSELDAEAQVTVHSGRAIGTLVEMVIGRRLDVALVADYPGHLMQPHAALTCATVAVEPVFVALSSRHPLAPAAEIALGDLAGERWVVPHSDGMGWPEHLFDACGIEGFRPNGRYRLSDTTLRRELVATGRAVTACQASFGASENIAIRPVAGDPLWMRHLLVWRSDSLVAPFGPSLAETAREAHRENMDRSDAYLRWSELRGVSDHGAGLFGPLG